MKTLNKAILAFALILFFVKNSYAQSLKNALSLEFTPSFGNRILIPGNNFSPYVSTTPEHLKGILDSSESGIFTHSISLSYIRRASRNFSISAGLGYVKMGKKRTIPLFQGYYESRPGTFIPIYAAEPIDLKSKIYYISLPVGLKYNFALNEKINLIASSEIIPMYAVTWTNPINTNIFIPINRFVLSSEVSIGFGYELNEKFELQISPNYLQQLTPGVTYWNDLKQYNYNLGLKFGTKVNL